MSKQKETAPSMNCVNDRSAKQIYEELLKSPPEGRRILSIQSHVVHGYVGNRCSVFPLQLHGYEVDFINSVQFSNHAGTLFNDVAYAHLKGQRLKDVELAELYEGLKLNDVDSYSHILTGYCGDPSFLLKIADVVKDAKAKNPDAQYYCDPVLGDNGRYYTPRELMPIYRDVLAPMADVITPNVFELSELCGQEVNDEKDCLNAIFRLHEMGVRTVVVTSGLETETTKFCYGSVKKGNEAPVQYRFDIPTLPGMFVGSGDIFTSLLLVWMDKLHGNIELSVQKVIGSLQGLLKRTGRKAYAGRDPKKYEPTVTELELQLVQSRVDLLCPNVPIRSIRILR